MPSVGGTSVLVSSLGKTSFPRAAAPSVPRAAPLAPRLSPSAPPLPSAPGGSVAPGPKAGFLYNRNGKLQGSSDKTSLKSSFDKTASPKVLLTKVVNAASPKVPAAAARVSTAGAPPLACPKVPHTFSPKVLCESHLLHASFPVRPHV